MNRKTSATTLALSALILLSILGHAKPAEARGSGAFGQGMTTGNWTPWLVIMGITFLAGIAKAAK